MTDTNNQQGESTTSPAIELVKLRARVKALTHALQNLLTETVADLLAEVDRLTTERDEARNMAEAYVAAWCDDNSAKVDVPWKAIRSDG